MASGDPAPVNEGGFARGEEEDGADPPGEAEARTVPEDLGQGEEGGIDDENVARQARRDAARDRKRERAGRPGRVGEAAPARLEDADRGEEGQMQVIEEERRVLARVAA